MEKNLESKVEISNVREDYYIIITAKQSVIQKVEDISLNNKTQDPILKIHTKGKRESRRVSL